MSIVEKCGYSDIAAALRDRGGLPPGTGLFPRQRREHRRSLGLPDHPRKTGSISTPSRTTSAARRTSGSTPRRSAATTRWLEAQRDLQLGHRAFRRDRHAHPLPEAYELVEDGHITADNFRDFTFTTRSNCGARRTRVSSKAPASPRKPPPSSPQPKPRPCRRRITPARAAPPTGGAAPRARDSSYAVRDGARRRLGSVVLAVRCASVDCGADQTPNAASKLIA